MNDFDLFVQTQNTVYEIVSDMSTRQDALEERLVSLEDKLTSVAEQLEMLPEAITRCIAQHTERLEQRRNFLHPDTAVALITPGGLGSGSGGLGGGGGIAGGMGSSGVGNSIGMGISGSIVSAHHPLASNSPLLPHSRSVPNAPSTMSLHPWPASPVLPPVSSRTPHLIPETGRQHHGIIQHSTTVPTTSQSATRLTSQAGMGGLGNSQGSDTSAHS